MAHGVVYNLNHPETSKLIQELQKLNNNLENLQKELDRLQATGLVDTLINLGMVVQAAKDSLTPGMISNILSQSVHVLSLLDHLQSLSFSQLITATVQAFEEAVQENKGKPPRNLWTLLRVLKKDPQVKKSVEILVSFLQKFSAHLNFIQAK